MPSMAEPSFFERLPKSALVTTSAARRDSGRLFRSTLPEGEDLVIDLVALHAWFSWRAPTRLACHATYGSSPIRGTAAVIGRGRW